MIRQSKCQRDRARPAGEQGALHRVAATVVQSQTCRWTRGTTQSCGYSCTEPDLPVNKGHYTELRLQLYRARPAAEQGALHRVAAAVVQSQTCRWTRGTTQSCGYSCTEPDLPVNKGHYTELRLQLYRARPAGEQGALHRVAATVVQSQTCRWTRGTTQLRLQLYRARPAAEQGALHRVAVQSTVWLQLYRACANCAQVSPVWVWYMDFPGVLDYSCELATYTLWVAL